MTRSLDDIRRERLAKAAATASSYSKQQVYNKLAPENHIQLPPEVTLSPETGKVKEDTEETLLLDVILDTLLLKQEVTASKVVNPVSRFPIPRRRSYYIPGYVQDLLTVVDSISSEGGNMNIAITGKQGCGKSELPNQYAATRNRPLCIVDCGLLSENKQIFGEKTLESGSILFRPSAFLEAIQTPYCVIHLQEINRIENDKALNAIFSVLDDTFRSIWLDDIQQLVKVAPGVVFFASLNEGFEFIGTLPLDEALRNRFAIKISLGYVPPEIEKAILVSHTNIQTRDAEEILKLVGFLRNNSQDPQHISTRDTVNMATLMSRGLSLTQSLFAVLGHQQDLVETLLLKSHLGGSTQKADLDMKYQQLR